MKTDVAKTTSVKYFTLIRSGQMVLTFAQTLKHLAPPIMVEGQGVAKVSGLD
jgi:hypothetical protein